MLNLHRRQFLQLLSLGAASLALPQTGCQKADQAYAADNVQLINLSEHLTVLSGAVNGALLTDRQQTLVIGGDPRPTPGPADLVLFTHHRRDVSWSGQQLGRSPAKIIVPADEKKRFTNNTAFWQQFREKRFHDYAQQTTKVLTRPLEVTGTAEASKTLSWQGYNIQVLNTPGYTRGAVTYLLDVDGQRVAFPGDLIYGKGQILDLYSLQDEIPEANIRGYHGYAARIADVIESLRKVARQNPDLLVPARGPVIYEPTAAINQLINQLQKVYRNYLSTNALRWYFGDEHIQTCANRVLGSNAAVESMPMASTYDLPQWVTPLGNSRLVRSETGETFLIDCGYQKIIDQVQALINQKEISSVEGIYITHYHDDHTDQAQTGAQQFDCPVYACQEQADVLTHPRAYQMPAMTDNPVENLRAMKDREQISWNEFTLTFYYLPGQTLYHGGLLIEKDNGETLFFIGDSFTPSGIDDYCLHNRNFMHKGMGYLYCLQLLEQIKGDYRLVNQHVKPTFSYSGQQIARLKSAYRKRKELLKQLLPWDDPNFGLDVNWSRCYPYEVNVRPGDTAEMAVCITNHSAQKQTFQLRPHPPEGWQVQSSQTRLSIDPYTDGKAQFALNAPSDAAPGTYLLTVDVQMNDWDLRRWTEGLITLDAV